MTRLHPTPTRRHALLGVLAVAATATTSGALSSSAPARTPAGRRPSRDPRVAAPFLTPTQFVRAALALHFVPAAQAFEVSATALQRQLDAGCADLDSARALWRTVMLNWERLSAVAVGPLLQRRAARALDFWPTRAPMIEAAVRAQPATVPELDHIGAPAKGLPALEWLLWQTAPDPMQCHYAALLAQDCAVHAQALRTGFDTLSQRDWDDEAALPVLHDWIGQIVGGLEQLRWKKIGKPARARTKGGWPRALSGSTRAAWAAHWQGLESMLLGPLSGHEQGSLNGLLRARGHLRLSTHLEAAVARTVTALAAANPHHPPTLQAAQQAIARTMAVVQDQAASALQITVGFSDADGD